MVLDFADVAPNPVRDKTVKLPYETRREFNPPTVEHVLAVYRLLPPHRRISLLHLGGVPWARIGEHVGQRNLAVTANTYTHVLVDEIEIDYAALVSS
jgi:hypothetical protein